eukprot:TRINITY_DN21336_c0_g1_i3.p1 TRINITY_DN21336_c0_g1~~TRINITY_DN21336_c0_g1_i3.p1  ORF type:complete len:232 (+),score=34.62 TRINITY_DN21336_c0_g1_i3:171-866(+)
MCIRDRKREMSLTDFDWKRATRAQLNKSCSKQSFAFAKDDRFKYYSGGYCQQAYYTLPDFKMTMKSTMSPKIGTEKRYDFGKGSITPAPLEYQLPSTLTKVGKSFGVGRDSFGKVFLGTVPQFSKEAPGPGTYDDKVPKIGKEASKFTMRMRTKLEENITAKIVPGPGNYVPVSSISPEGKFKVSTFKDTGAYKFNPPSSGRFTQIKSNSCLLYTSPSPRDLSTSRMPSSA